MHLITWNLQFRRHGINELTAELYLYTGVVMQNLENINVTEVLDRVLDHGIVMDPSARVMLMGVDLHTIKGHFVVESVQTYAR
jgi:hypothetical protein